MILAVSASNVEQTLKILDEHGETAWQVGNITTLENGPQVVFQGNS